MLATYDHTPIALALIALMGTIVSGLFAIKMKQLEKATKRTRRTADRARSKADTAVKRIRAYSQNGDLKALRGGTGGRPGRRPDPDDHGEPPAIDGAQI